MAESGQKYRLPFTADAYPRLLAFAIAKAREACESSVEALVEALRGKAHRWPPDWNQMPEVHEAHRRLINETVAADHPYPAERSSGRGIVTVAGGKYAVSGYVLCRMLRELGCRLPIQVWHLGVAEIDDGMRRLLLAIDGVELVDAHERLAGRPRIFGGWQAKIWTIMESPFREVLYLDADNVPIRDPSYLFDQAGYREAGAMLWPDLHNRPGMDITEQGFLTAGLPVPGRTRDPKHDKPTDYDPVESGQILVDKSRCWPALQLVRHLNDHSDYWFPQSGGRRPHWHCYGDKSTFFLGFQRAGRYAMPSGPDWIGDSRGGAFVQRDLDGVPVFQHRCQPPGKLQVAGLNIHPAGFKGADMVDQIVSELRRDWHRGFSGTETEACDAAMLAAIPGDYEWFQGPRRRPMMLLDGGRTMDNRHSWAARRRDGVTYLAITADDGVTSLLGETRDGSWCRHDRDEFLVRAPPPSWRMIRERSELGMYGDIVHANEYRLPERFEPTDIILDIGAHVGVFANECLRRGCGRIVCVEPCSDNFESLASNLRSW